MDCQIFIILLSELKSLGKENIVQFLQLLRVFFYFDRQVAVRHRY